jgi:hypothetical protein
MLNIYLYTKLEGVQHVPILNYYFGISNITSERVGDNALKLLNKQFFNIVKNPEEADYFLAPHDYFSIVFPEYWHELSELTKKFNRKVIIFAYGDRIEPVNVENSFIFRTSQYKDFWAKPTNSTEVIIPAFADDLLTFPLVTKDKGTTPLIGFCGWATFPKRYSLLKRLAIYLIELTQPLYLRRGILLRKKILKVLRESKKIGTNFIVRQSYSGNEKTREGDLAELRKEYIHNILESDLSLAIKGAGNFSIRFYEILSLGRIPLFVDTKCVLPLEDLIQYDKFILKIDYTDIQNIADTVVAFYQNISNDEFVMMQRHAREIFEKYLRIDRYFEYIFLKNPDFLKSIQ